MRCFTGGGRRQTALDRRQVCNACESWEGWLVLDDNIFSFWWYMVASQCRGIPQRGCVEGPGMSVLVGFVETDVWASVHWIK